MAYMNPQQWRDALIGIGQGKRFTAYEDPNEADPRDVLKFTGRALDRVGAPNRAASRAASGTYDPIPIQQASTGTGLTPLQKSLEQFNQQQAGRDRHDAARDRKRSRGTQDKDVCSRSHCGSCLYNHQHVRR